MYSVDLGSFARFVQSPEKKTKSLEFQSALTANLCLGMCLANS